MTFFLGDVLFGDGGGRFFGGGARFLGGTFAGFFGGGFFFAGGFFAGFFDGGGGFLAAAFFRGLSFSSAIALPWLRLFLASLASFACSSFAFLNDAGGSFV